MVAGLKITTKAVQMEGRVRRVCKQGMMKRPRPRNEYPKIPDPRSSNESELKMTRKTRLLSWGRVAVSNEERALMGQLPLWRGPVIRSDRRFD